MRSLQLQLPDPVYDEVQRAANAAGFADLETYVVDPISQETENFDHLFTPERLAIIDRADAEVKAGHFRTMEQYEARLAEMKTAWKKANPS